MVALMATTVSHHHDTALPGLIAMATGIGIGLTIHLTSPQPGDAPSWVGDACAAAFFFAGLCLFAQSRHWSLLSKLAGLGAAYMLMIPGIWVVFAGDPKRCSIGIVSGPLNATGGAGGLCGAVFGIGTFIAVLIALAMTWQAFHRRPN